MNGVQVRLFSPADSGPLLAVAQSTGVFRPEELEVAQELLEAAAERGEASGYLFRVAAVDGALQGYACYGPTPCTQGTFDLYWIAVDPSYHGQGVASLLLEEVEKDLRRRGARLLVAETEDSAAYASARAFYEAKGFDRAAFVSDFYRPGDAKIIYVKTLTESTGGQ